MKRYLAFYGFDFYPQGGMKDFVNDFDSLEDAIEAIKNAHENNRISPFPEYDCWGSVYDSLLRKEVWYLKSKNS